MLKVSDLHVEYSRGGAALEILHGVSFEVPLGSALALVGESGSGKSTLALAVLRMIVSPAGRITSGEVQLEDTNLTSARRSEVREVLRHRIGFIPQDPTTSLDPLFTIESQVGEVLPRMSRKEQREVIADLLDKLGVVDARGRLGCYPHEFSGGMRQRVAMAIALAKDPQLLIADEPTSALDVTTQVALLRLLDELRLERSLTTLFITHNLKVARLLCQQVAVMYAGYIVEAGPMATVLASPSHPYTKALMTLSIEERVPGTKLPVIAGQPPSPQDVRGGCPFAERCPRVIAACASAVPEVTDRGDGVSFRCWNPVAA